MRDDIVFRRLGLNQALLAYRRIREGSLFVEEVAPELNALDAKLDERFRDFETMRSIAQRVDGLLPDVGADPDQILSALEATTPHLETFQLARTNVERINGEIGPLVQALVIKADKVQTASGDSNSRQLMSAYIDGKDRYYQDEFAKLVVEADRLDNKKKQLVDQLIAEGKLPPTGLAPRG